MLFKHANMYQKIANICDYFVVTAAIVMLLAFLISELQHLLGLDTVPGLVIYSSILAGAALASRRLQRLAYYDACIATLGTDLEAASETIIDDEIKRRREESRR